MIIISLLLYRDTLSPAFLISLPWLASIGLLLPSNLNYDENSFSFLYIAIGILIFNIGFLLSSLGKKSNRTVDLYKMKISVINLNLIKYIIYIELILLITYSFFLAIYIKNNYIFNVYYTLKLGSANGNLITLNSLGYLFNFITAFSAFLLFIYIKGEKLISKKMLFVQMLIGTVSSFLTLGRTAILLYFLLLIITTFIYKNADYKKIIKQFVLLGVVGIVFFSIYNLIKYPYLLESSSIIEVAFNSLVLYASGSIITFQSWINSNVELLYGDNTFRFVKALLAAVGYEVQVQELVNPFMAISNDYSSNVYSFYYYYAKDFGLVYALFVQLIIGMIYGYLYKRMTFKHPFWVYVFSLSLYPLFMQFFQDQYVSLTSTWIQYTFFGIFLFKTRLFYRASYAKI